jgi:hypothetical protein
MDLVVVTGKTAGNIKQGKKPRRTQNNLSYILNNYANNIYKNGRIHFSI